MTCGLAGDFFAFEHGEAPLRVKLRGAGYCYLVSRSGSTALSWGLELMRWGGAG